MEHFEDIRWQLTVLENLGKRIAEGQEERDRIVGDYLQKISGAVSEAILHLTKEFPEAAAAELCGTAPEAATQEIVPIAGFSSWLDTQLRAANTDLTTIAAQAGVSQAYLSM